MVPVFHRIAHHYWWTFPKLSPIPALNTLEMQTCLVLADCGMSRSEAFMPRDLPPSDISPDFWGVHEYGF
ncbi:hypothetical protein IAQ61_003206 [Plenodomus lingam]|uniref:uncharacterized protein n=1 Tax=Leptosphaeria maculans TaxID=5022 RepID=UPI00332E9006|nr:hypothetical protein IAQ61_003206 [Plenodomus lingam]